MLVQSDTNQAASLSQTLLNVAVFYPANGASLSDQHADVPGVNTAYSSWIETGNEGFH